MDVLYYLVLSVYIFAINLYGIMILNFQKKAINSESCEKPQITHAKIFLTGILGGASGLFLFMFILKHKLKSFIFMVFMPVCIAINLYLFYIAFFHGWNFITPLI